MGSEGGRGFTLGGVIQAVLDVLDGADVAAEVVVEGDAGAEIVHANAARARILGVAPGERAAAPWRERIAPDERARALAELEAPEPPGRHRRIETAIVRPDGARVPVEACLASLSVQGRDARVTLLTDLGERRRTEAALRESEARFRQLAEAAPDAIVVLRDGRFRYVNPAATSFLGFDRPQELYGRAIGELLSPGEPRAMAERLGRISNGERLTPREYTARRKDGSLVTLEIVSIQTEFEGEPAVVGFGRSVDERKRLQAEALQADRMAAVGTLAAGVAHEINNPLTYLLLNLQRLRQSLDHIVPDPAQRARAAGLLDDALDGGERVRVVVRDLLAFARADASAQGPVDVGAVLESSLKLADNALRHRARVETDLAAVPPVKANAARLGQVFLNLLVNAAQSFEDDNDAVNRVRVRLRCGAGDLVVVEIEDNGCGIPDDALPHVFEPFFTTKPIGAGTGLGLPITRSILDALGGDLTLASEPGAGTTARVLLPAIRLTPEADTSAPPMPPAGTRRARVMLVDDEAALARAVATELARDHEVKVFTHSALARDELLRDPDYDAVVCDLIMPELSGMELYRQVCRRHPHYTDRFVFVTGGAFTRRAAEFVATTPAAVLLKPFDGKAVGAAIARRLAETTTPDVLA